MKTGREKSLIIHIAGYCREIADTIKRFGESYEIFSTDLDYYKSVSMSIQQIGELVSGIKKTNPDFFTKYSTYPWNDMIGIRNHFAHGYYSMDSNIIWDVAENDIPELLDFCNMYLSEG
jgi:uncharacterized protein with HEPN domain